MDRHQNRTEYERYWACLLLFLIFGLAALGARAEQHKPRWTASIGMVDHLYATPDMLLAMGDGSLTALDRQNGHLLWRMPGRNSTKTEGTITTTETQAFTFVGVTTPKRPPQIVVLVYAYELA